MKAYKFLARGRRGVFSGFEWPESRWVEANGSIEICRAGIHACRPKHLAYWISEELWEIELDGEVVETALKVVASQGRLGERVTAWNKEARRNFMAQGVLRTVHYAVLELQEVGLAAQADLLDAAALDDVVHVSIEVREAALEAEEDDAADLASFVGDAATYASADHVAGPALVAAHAAVRHAPVGVTDPFAAEREWQSLWLAQRLGLNGE